MCEIHPWLALHHTLRFVLTAMTATFFWLVRKLAGRWCANWPVDGAQTGRKMVRKLTGRWCANWPVDGAQTFRQMACKLAGRWCANWPADGAHVCLSLRRCLSTVGSSGRGNYAKRGVDRFSLKNRGGGDSNFEAILCIQN